MRKEENGKLTQVRCNGCGRELKLEKEIIREGYFAADVRFGYFSRKDGLRHKFDLCEDCYDKMDRYICHSGGRTAGDRAFIERQKKMLRKRQIARKDVRRLLIGNRRNDATALQMADFPDDAL